MQIWNLPLIFKGSENYLSAGAGIDICLYRARQETVKANVQFTANAVIILLDGYKEVMSASHKIAIKAGEGFFLKKGNYIMTEKPAVSSHYESIMVFFDDAIAGRIAAGMHWQLHKSDSPLTELIRIPLAANCLSFAQSLKSYFNLQSAVNGLAPLLEIKLQELFWLLAHADTGSQFLSFLKQLQNRESYSIERLMEQHYRASISLEQLAFLGGYSLSTFKRRVEDHYHTSPRKWIQERRLQEAFFLLKSTDMNVSEVSMEVGFENVSHFVKVFKEKWGITPGQAKTVLV
ncbi:AraC family transcriptional regulator [Cesiribacter sp. SM1]|uniref:helix-turn-helix transcriptional regulator n=1 Tax=Cesiribacter sp. SM1 TaxID=2861196 RepID=UPI001CD3223E|nr:AraC family transcriptional regulator [Cesiribacter sp. SM1]